MFLPFAIPASLLASMSGCSEAQAHSVPKPAPEAQAPQSPELVEVSAEEQSRLQELVEVVATRLKPDRVEHAFGNDPCPPCGMG